MLESITIADVATFGTAPEVLGDLRQINYIFGSNGTGKTTISRVIADPETTCPCSWKNGTRLETFVLNRDFVEKNFDQLRGVFTLGKEQRETLDKIDAAKKELDRENEELAKLKTTVEGDDGTGGKNGELTQLERDLQDKCWAQKQKHDTTLQGAFTGYRNNAQNFKQKVLQEAASNNADLKDLGDLEARAATIFGEAPAKHAVIPALDTTDLLAHEVNPILKKKVMGKGDVDIAAMIEKLGNSDWVRQGVPYYDANDQVCPFCQQDTTEAFATSLTEYFDETFEKDSSEITTIASQYSTDATAVQSTIEVIIAAPSKFLDVGKLEAEKAALDQAIAANQLRLDNKKKEPSQIIELESLDPILASIKSMIKDANAQIAKHNRMVDNLAAEKKTLTSEVWRFVLNELDVDLKQYQKKKEGTEKAIAAISTKIDETSERIRGKEKEIRDLEKKTTSIQPTIDAINGILLGFGFDSFKLAMATDGKHYRLIRQSGEDARPTLSEGEKTFVVFLYFYHWLKGSIAESSVTTDRVVVFDDPVSSLDSDVLFIVSSLIKEICENVRAGAGHIKQVFVLTHNVYFHKEVTYNGKRRQNGAFKEESFWIVRKCGQHSKLERHAVNPIKTSYELLWMEVRNAKTTNPRIENTLRRILEHYFTILGSIDPDDICKEFDGQDRPICKSLFSWVNAGSHSAFDDAHITLSDGMTQNYLRVFKAIFEKKDHLAHYKMMMHEGAADGNDPELDEQKSEALAGSVVAPSGPA